jgi:hypothetical protein
MSDAALPLRPRADHGITQEDVFASLFNLFAESGDADTAIAIGDQVRVSADCRQKRMAAAILTVGKGGEATLNAAECRRLAAVLTGAALAMGG